MAATVSKTDYLKRYMSKNELPKDERKKKKRKINPSKNSKLRIIDDDLDLRKLKPGKAAQDDEVNDEAPTVAEIVDERPKHVQQLEAYRKDSRWKVLGDDDDDDVRGLEYGVITYKHYRLHGSDSEKSKIPQKQLNDDITPPRKKDHSTGRQTNQITDKRSRRHDSDSSDNAATNPRRTGSSSSDDDNSPAKMNTTGPTARAHHDSTSDNSPPRNRAPGSRTQARHDSSSDNSPTRKKISNSVTQNRHDTDSDNSPPRKKTSDPGGKIRHDSDSDNSPPRKKTSSPGTRIQQDSDSDNSPPRKKAPEHTKRTRHDSDSDYSPPRKAQTKSSNGNHTQPRSSDKLTKSSTKNSKHSDSDNSPPRKANHQHGSDSPKSAQRKGQHKSSDLDQSPPRKLKSNRDMDQSPPRKLKSSRDMDSSPPRRKQYDGNQSDRSLSRRSQLKPGQNKSATDSQDRRKPSPVDSVRSSGSRLDVSQQDPENRKATKTLSGAKAGLSSAREMRDEAMKLREKEDRMFQRISEEELGRNAKTVVRNKETGKKRDLKAEEEENEEEARKKAEQVKKYQQWGKGMKQQVMKDLRLEEQAHEASKPLARFRDDKDLDEMLRREERVEDPMLEFIRSKRKKEEQKSGKKKEKELPRYKGPAPPPNRFNIMPGYRWDGVDRSNGFEKKIYAKMADKKAVQEMAYKWSTEDM